MEAIIKMYKIYLGEEKIKIPCKDCLDKGYISTSCKKCGGKGIHNKTIKKWKVAIHPENVEKINRGRRNYSYRGTPVSYDNGLQYWINQSEFYTEESKLLHFCKEDAQYECDKRNKEMKSNTNTDPISAKVPEINSGDIVHDHEGIKYIVLDTIDDETVVALSENGCVENLKRHILYQDGTTNYITEILTKLR